VAILIAPVLTTLLTGEPLYTVQHHGQNVTGVTDGLSR